MHYYVRISKDKLKIGCFIDHVVYLDAKSKELEKLFKGSKTMIIRCATGRKLPYRRVFEGDILYFINNNSEGVVKASMETWMTGFQLKILILSEYHKDNYRKTNLRLHLIANFCFEVLFDFAHSEVKNSCCCSDQVRLNSFKQ